jgi:phenylacetic acid degradation operon negative regulatory protein
VTEKISPRTLVEAFLPFDREADLSLIYDTANEIGIEDQPVRLTVRRLVAAGEVAQRGRGRSGRLQLTEAGRARLSGDRAAVRLVFAQDAGLAPWDGLWRLLAISAPESRRAVRDAFRRDIVSLGAAACSTGLYVTPHDLTPLLSPDVTPYLVAAEAENLTVRGLADPQEIVESLWPAQGIIDGYAPLAHALDATSESITPLARRLRLADALEKALRDDPLIPTELRAGAWEPARLRRRWRESWEQTNDDGDARSIFQGWLPE